MINFNTQDVAALPKVMTVDQFFREQGVDLKDESAKCGYFRNNMLTGRLPVALYACAYCHTILWDGRYPCPEPTCPNHNLKPGDPAQMRMSNA